MAGNGFVCYRGDILLPGLRKSVRPRSRRCKMKSVILRSRFEAGSETFGVLLFLGELPAEIFHCLRNASMEAVDSSLGIAAQDTSVIDSSKLVGPPRFELGTSSTPRKRSRPLLSLA